MNLGFEDAIYLCGNGKFLLRPTHTKIETDFVEVKTALKRLYNSEPKDITFLVNQPWEVIEKGVLS